MDSLTISISQMNVPWLTLVAALLENEFVFIFSILALVLLSERRKEKILKMAIAVFVAIVLVAALKNIIKVDRPCTNIPAKIECPVDYSFPSGHTIVAFTVMIAFLNKPTFIVYFTYAIFIAFTRIYLGVHTFEDVAGSIAFAPFVYYLGEIIWKKVRGKNYAFGNGSEQ